VFTFVPAHINQIASPPDCLECCLYHGIGRANESYHGSIGSLARINIQQSNALYAFNFVSD
jgi:hypothetical protein